MITYLLLAQTLVVALPADVKPSFSLGGNRLFCSGRMYYVRTGKADLFTLSPPGPQKDASSTSNSPRNDLNHEAIQLGYVKLVEVSDGKACLRDLATNKVTHLRLAKGEDTFQFGEGEKLIRGQVVRLSLNELVFRVGNAYYAIGLGESMAHALREPLGKDRLKELKLELKPAGAGQVLDEKLLQGVWEALTIEFDGAITTAADLRRPERYQIPPRNLFGEAEAKPAEMGILRWTITGDKITLGEKKPTFSFKLNSKATPKQIDLLPLDGPDKGKTVQGIYRFDDDRLSVCFLNSSDPQNTWPRAFKTSLGDGLIMVTLEPAKKVLAPRKDGSTEKKIQDVSPREKKEKRFFRDSCG